MSESKQESSTVSAAQVAAVSTSTSTSSGENQLWSKFYIQTCVLLTNISEKLEQGVNIDDDELNKLHQRVRIWIWTEDLDFNECEHANND